MAANRSAGTDVYINDANDRDTILGGLILTNCVTGANFYLLFDGGSVLVIW